MHQISRFKQLSIVIGLLVMAAAPVSADEAADAWSRGQQAFQEQDYLLALSHFEKARRAGQAGPAVHYNIAVCQYKLQNYHAARQSFALINQQYPKMRSLSEYNLGLVALKQSDRQLARRHFRESYRLSGDNEKLTILSATMVRRTRPPTTDSSKWVRLVSVRTGYDDNVSLQDVAALAVGTSGESPLAEVWASIRGPITGGNGFRFDASAYLIRYFDNDAFDQNAARLGGLYEWRDANWRVRLGVHGSTTTLGGDGFDRSTNLSAILGRSLSSSTSIEIRLRHDEISAVDAIFAGVDGSRERAELRYRWFLDDRRLNLTLGIETNDRFDQSVSPRRNRLRLDYRYTPRIGWGFEFAAEFRASKYDDLVPIRDEDLTKLKLALLKNLGTNWQLFARYEFSNNESSDPSFSYTRNQISFGVLRIY